MTAQAQNALELSFVLVGRPRRYRFESGRVVVGRVPDCDVVVTDASISRHHATIESEGGAWVVRDAGSANGTIDGGR